MNINETKCQAVFLRQKDWPQLDRWACPKCGIHISGPCQDLQGLSGVPHVAVTPEMIEVGFDAMENQLYSWESALTSEIKTGLGDAFVAMWRVLHASTRERKEPSTRKYSVSEIDRMRDTIDRYYDTDGPQDAAERLRTYMLNGTDPDELEAAGRTHFWRCAGKGGE